MTSPRRHYRSLEPGDAAPRFSLPAVPGGSVTLDDVLHRHHVVLVFHKAVRGTRATFDGLSATAATSLCALSADADAFARAGARIVSVSRDAVRQLAGLSVLLKLRFPLLSDMTGDVGEEYGLLPTNRWAGSNYTYDVARAVFVVDKHGIVRFTSHADLIVSPRSKLPEPLRTSLDESLHLWLGAPATLQTQDLLDVIRAL
jgi:peroxiredoxin Q/BCP